MERSVSSAPLVDTRRPRRSWLGNGHRRADLGLAVALTTLALADAVAEGYGSGGRSLDAVAVVMVVAGGAALTQRRRLPVLVLAVISVVTIAFWLRGHGAFLAVLGLPALYSVAVHESDRRRAWVAMVVATLGLVGVAGQTVLRSPDGLLLPAAITMAAYLAAAIAVGLVVRHRASLVVDAQERAERAEADRRAAADRAVAEERSRIAREMHDVIAHSMSVITVQAGAAQEVVHTRPDKAVEVLARIEDVSRESLAEMRRMLGVLRNDDVGSPSLLPQPGLDALPGLVEESRAAGVDVDLRIEGDRRPLAPGIDLAAYRIVQESLTNVRKHAAPGATATVVVRFGTASLGLCVTDNGSADTTIATPPGSGNGLVGIRERVSAYGGTVTVGPEDGGRGWRVEVSLPTTGSANRTTRAGSPTPGRTTDGVAT